MFDADEADSDGDGVNNFMETFGGDSPGGCR